jgi:hypothetical protein
MKNPLVNNTLIILASIFIGSIINMSIVLLGPNIIPPPNAADVTTMKGLKESMHLFQPKHFLFPFLAHALGTFNGALIATKFSKFNNTRNALIVGVIFLIGGVMDIFSLPTPIWFALIDLIIAYIPMAYLATKLVMKK